METMATYVTSAGTWQMLQWLVEIWALLRVVSSNYIMTVCQVHAYSKIVSLLGVCIEMLRYYDNNYTLQAFCCWICPHSHMKPTQCSYRDFFIRFA